MTKRRLYTITLLLLAATAPWPFCAGAAPSHLVFGFPEWAAYSLGLTVLFAWVTHRFLVRYWDLSAQGADDDAGVDPRGPAHGRQSAPPERGAQ